METLKTPEEIYKQHMGHDVQINELEQGNFIWNDIKRLMEEYASQFREKPKNNQLELFNDLRLDKTHFIPIIQNWLSYKTQKRQTYKPIGLKTLIKKFNEFKGSYSELESLVENSIINNYSGIIWDKKVNNGNQQQSTYEKHEQGFDALFGSGSPFAVPES